MPLVLITWATTPWWEEVFSVKVSEPFIQNETITRSWGPAALLTTCLHHWPREWATDNPYWYWHRWPTRFNQLLDCVGGLWYQRTICLDRISDEPWNSCYWAARHIWSHSLPLKCSARIIKLLGPTNWLHWVQGIFLFLSVCNHLLMNNVSSNNVYFPLILPYFAHRWG